MSDHNQYDVGALALQPMRPAGPQPGFVGGTFASVRDIWAHRELLGQITRREIKARYKDSILGLFWSLIRPLALLLTYWLVMGRFLGAERGIPEFAIYLFSGITAWTLFAEIVGPATSSIVLNGGLIKKVYVPREIFPLATIGSALFNFLLQFVILFVFMLIRRQFPTTWENWSYFLVAMVLLLLWATTLALLFAAVNVYLRDVQYLVEIGLMLAFWASPIVYSWEQAGGQMNRVLQNLYLANPMTLVATAFQQAFWLAGVGKPRPDHLITRMTVAIAISVVLLWLAQRIFARLQSNFAQEL